MPDPNKQMLNPPEVVVVPSATETSQEVVNNEQAETTSQPEVDTQTVAPEEQTPVVPATNLDVDEFGVPWKNRAMENRRKLDELTERLPQIIEEKLKSVSQPQTQQYTYEQLEAYKTANMSEANIVSWATAEQRKIQLAENKRMIEEVVGGREKVLQDNIRRQKAVEYVQQTYPDAFVKDVTGKPMSWNQNHPMTQEIGRLMQDSRLANDPDALAFVADAAYGRYARTQNPVLQQKTQQLKQEVRQLQKTSLVEGGGRKFVQTTTPKQSAMENLRKTGSLRDATSAIGEILKSRGILNE